MVERIFFKSVYLVCVLVLHFMEFKQFVVIYLNVFIGSITYTKLNSESFFLKNLPFFQKK